MTSHSNKKVFNLKLVSPFTSCKVSSKLAKKGKKVESDERALAKQFYKPSLTLVPSLCLQFLLFSSALRYGSLWMNGGYRQKEMNESTCRSKEDQLQHLKQALSSHQRISPLIGFIFCTTCQTWAVAQSILIFWHKYFEIRFSCTHDPLHCIDIDVSLISDVWTPLKVEILRSIFSTDGLYSKFTIEQQS